MAQSYEDEKTNAASWKQPRVHLFANEGAFKEFLQSINVESLGGGGCGGGANQRTIKMEHGITISAVINLQEGKILDADIKISS